MYIDFIVDLFLGYMDDVALICNNKEIKYSVLKQEYEYWIDKLKENNIFGKVVSVQGEFGPETIDI